MLLDFLCRSIVHCFTALCDFSARSQRGATIAEHALLLTLVVAVAIPSVQGVGKNAQGVFNVVEQGAVDSAINPVALSQQNKLGWGGVSGPTPQFGFGPTGNNIGIEALGGGTVVSQAGGIEKPILGNVDSKIGEGDEAGSSAPGNGSENVPLSPGGRLR